MVSRDPDTGVLDDLFHGCALAAFLALAAAAGRVPDPEATRRLAYRYYEAALAEKGAARSRLAAGAAADPPGG